MSAGGSFNPSGGPIDNQQRLQTSPNPSLPPADYSMGYARNFQPPSFFNPFSGYYGANTGMGGFQPQFGGFQQPQFGGFGGFQQPQYGGFQQQQFGGFGGGFQQPFGGGFGRQSNRFTRRGQEYTQPYMPQPQPPQMPPDFGSGMGGFGGFNPMMGGGIGAFGGFQQQRDPNAPPPGMMVNPDYDSSQAMLMNRPLPGSRESLVRQPFIRDQSQPERLPANMMGGFGGFNPMTGMQGELVPRAVQPTTEMERQMEGRPYHTGAFGPHFGGGAAPPAPPMFGMNGEIGLRQISAPITAPSDYEIANSLGFKDPNAGRDMATWVLPDEAYKKRDIQKQSDAKKYLDSIGYGQAGFDPSKYEVKREVRPSSGIGSLFSGFGRGFA